MMQRLNELSMSSSLPVDPPPLRILLWTDLSALSTFWLCSSTRITLLLSVFAGIPSKGGKASLFSTNVFIFKSWMISCKSSMVFSSISCADFERLTLASKKEIRSLSSEWSFIILASKAAIFESCSWVLFSRNWRRDSEASPPVSSKQTPPCTETKKRTYCVNEKWHHGSYNCVHYLDLINVWT